MLPCKISFLTQQAYDVTKNSCNSFRQVLSIGDQTQTSKTMQSDLNLSDTPAPLRSTDAADEDAGFAPAKGMIDSVIKPLIAVDFQGNILDITPVAAMLLRGQVNKFKGAHISAIFPELQGEADWAALPGLSTQAQRGDGSPMPVRLTVMRVISDYLDGWMVFVQPRKAPVQAEPAGRAAVPRTPFERR
ncbi:MAG: hypothetical protein JWN73_1252 [Betaproteobacteria bacterium]|nr:hypothetical protein [Betaproteobacteria bacterium]